jgi:hypothetical protein
MWDVRRLCVALVIVVSIGVPASAAFAGSGTANPGAATAGMAAGAANEVPTTTAFDPSCAKPAIVKPNCGVKPEQAGDRGGALQYTVWGLLVVGLAVVFTVVFRSASRTNRRRTNDVGDKQWS